MAVGRNPRVTLIRAVALGLFCVVIAKFVFLPVRVDGISMWPTYQDRSVNFINRLAYLWHEPQRGDVVGIRLAPPGRVMFLKRIIGLPGETVRFIGGKVWIDGKLLREPYEHVHSDWSLGPIKLGPDEYFVVGDNRSMPKEDHVKGKAARNRIIGKIML